MHSFLPVTESYHFVNRVNEIVQKTQQTQWQDCFSPFSVHLTLRVGGSTKVLLCVATCSSLQDTLSPLPFRTLPLTRWYDRGGCMKDIKDTLKTKRAPGSLIHHHWTAHSSYRKSSQVSISSQKKLSAFMADGTWREETDINVNNGPPEQRCPCQPVCPKGAIFSSTIWCISSLVLYWVTVTTQTPGFKTSLSKGGVAVCHCPFTLSRGLYWLQRHHPSPNHFPAIYL